MPLDKKRVKDIRIAYIGGGSCNWAWILMGDLALERQLSGEVRLYDIDFDAAKNNEIIGNKLSALPEVQGKWRYRTVSTLKQALDGADFIIISILPATFKEMESDVHTPEQYGIYQSVGDTVGPGGIIRALRTLPIFIDFARAIKQAAPRAWVINYTNPMTLCTRMLYECFPEIKAFGCCHEVFGTQKLLAAMLEELRGLQGIKRQEIKINVLGINHFTWIDKATYKTMDLFPLYAQFVEKYYDTGFEGLGKWTNSVFSSAFRVSFDLFKRYGLIAATGDRHLAEFLPDGYLKDPAITKSWKFHLTPVRWRVNDRQQRKDRTQRLITGSEKFKLKQSGEEGIKQIKALLGLYDLKTNVNLPNTNQMQGIPTGAVVETNACFSANSIRPVFAGKLPQRINILVLRHIKNQEKLVQAVVRQDKDMAFQVFLNDPLVNIKPNQARELFEQMLKNTESYLPDWLK